MTDSTPKKRAKPKLGLFALCADKRDPELVEAALDAFEAGSPMDLNEFDLLGRTPLENLLSGGWYETDSKGKPSPSGIERARELEAQAVRALALGANPLLQAAEAEVRWTRVVSPLKAAFSKGRLDFLRAAAASVGPDVCLAHLVEKRPDIPMEAAASESPAQTQILVEWGFDVSGRAGADMLMAAQSEETAKALLDAGADPNFKYDNGRTLVEALGLSSRKGAPKTLALVARAAKASGSAAAPEEELSRNVRAVFSAFSKSGPRDAFAVAKALGVPLDALDDSGRSLLARSLACGKLRTADALLKKGADPLRVGVDGIPDCAFVLFAQEPPSTSAKTAFLKDRKLWLAQAASWIAPWRAAGGLSLGEALASIHELSGMTRADRIAAWISGDSRLEAQWSPRAEIVEWLGEKASRPDSEMPRPWLSILAELHVHEVTLAGAHRRPGPDGQPRNPFALDAAGRFVLAEAFSHGVNFDTQSSWSWSRGLQLHEADRFFAPLSGSFPSDARDALGRPFCAGVFGSLRRRFGTRSPANAPAQIEACFDSMAKAGILSDPAQWARPYHGYDSLAEAFASCVCAVFETSESQWEWRRPRQAGSKGPDRALELLCSAADRLEQAGAPAEETAAFWLKTLVLSFDRLSEGTLAFVEAKALEAATIPGLETNAFASADYARYAAERPEPARALDAAATDASIADATAPTRVRRL